MKYVVKLGGATLENEALLKSCARSLATLVRAGHQVAVVHGGGVQLTRTLHALGKQSEFISGLRITDAETRDTALMVLAGRVNKSLVAALGTQGIAGVGLCGGDGLAFRARKKHSAGPGLCRRNRRYRHAHPGRDLADRLGPRAVERGSGL
jgi:acetylglutamate kinase